MIIYNNRKNEIIFLFLIIQEYIHFFNWYIEIDFPNYYTPNSYTPGINVLFGINSNLGFLGSFIYI